MQPRRQCKKCPWKVSTDPHTIPNGYSVDKHRDLSVTIARPGVITTDPISMMACHETPPGAELPCVGWLVHQLGPGNNLGLRMRAMSGQVDANVEVVGEQHPDLASTLPQVVSLDKAIGS